MGGIGSGRKTKPAALLANPRPRRSAVTVDSPMVKLRVPDGTAPEVATVFRRLVRQLAPAGILRETDSELLLQLATALWLNRTAAAELVEHGAVYEDKAHGGRLAKNPAFQVWRDSAATVRSLSALFGLSPSDRERLRHVFDNGGNELTIVDLLAGMADAD